MQISADKHLGTEGVLYMFDFFLQDPVTAHILELTLTDAPL